MLDQLKRDRPSVDTYRYEKELKKIATRGVVALFNAVSEAQKPAEDETAKLAKDMDKSEFLSMLKNKTDGDKQNSNNTTGNSKAGASVSAAPSYLRDDFLKGASMKHWDQEDDEEDDDGEGGQEGPEVSDDDDDSDSDSD